MACEFFRIDNCGCGGCAHFTRSTAIAVTGGNVVITIPSETVRNCEKTCICLAQNIPEGATAATPVVVEVTGIADTFALLNKCGNTVRGDQLRSRKVLHAIALTDIPAFKLCDNNLCKTDYTPSVLVPTVGA